MKDLNHASQKGLNELFDDSIGRGTVLKPFGGRTQNSPEDVSVQKFPTDGFTNSVSMASFGFDPRVSRWSPYHGAYFAVKIGRASCRERVEKKEVDVTLKKE